MPPFSFPQNNAQNPEQRITYFGVTDTRGKHVPFGIKQDDRSKHTYVIGKSGMGKSTLLENMAVQDIQNGEGMCFIDPHGSTAEKLLQYIPEHRVKDVLYFAPFDLQYPISFNVLENVDGDKRHLVVAGLMSAFEKIWVDAWSARMAYILQNTIAALLEFPGATLLGVNRMYIDKDYRKNVIAHVTDPSVRSFWVDEFAKYTDRYAQEATPAIQNKIGQFASNALVRNVIGQEHSSFNIRDIMDKRKIFIVNLSKGRVGEGNANLLGSMLITKIYLAAMSRADVPASEQRSLPPFFLFVDEFQNFANKSFAEILSEARKYKLSLTIAHQYIEQMEEEVRAAVFGNVGTMISFRVGAYDAEVLEKEYAPTFEIDDIVNLGARQIYLKLMIDSVSSQPFSATTLPPIPEPEVNSADRAIAFSRAQYARPRAEVEKSIKDWSEKKFEDPEAEGKERAREERRSAREADEGRAPARPTASPLQRDRPQSDRPFVRQAPVRGGGVPVRPHPQTRVERPVQKEGGQGRDTRTSSPRDDRQPRPTVTPPPRVFPPPPAPMRREESREDLRSTLAKLAQPVEKVTSDRSQATEVRQQKPDDGDLKHEARSQVKDNRFQRIDVGDREPKTENENPSLNNPQPTIQNPPPKPLRDDGKGVTDEGKEKLRALLASLTKTASGTENTPSSAQKNTNTSAPASVSAPSSQKPPQTPLPTSPQKTRKEISPQELREMLHVDKPAQ